jgi:hypothetical protein
MRLCGRKRRRAKRARVCSSPADALSRTVARSSLSSPRDGARARRAKIDLCARAAAQRVVVRTRDPRCRCPMCGAQAPRNGPEPARRRRLSSKDSLHPAIHLDPQACEVDAANRLKTASVPATPTALRALPSPDRVALHPPPAWRSQPTGAGPGPARLARAPARPGWAGPARSSLLGGPSRRAPGLPGPDRVHVLRGWPR